MRYENDGHRRRYKTATERLIGWTVLAGVTAATMILWWVDYHAPAIVVWFANRVAVLGSAYGMAWWKRAWYAWAVFWVLAAMQFAGFILDLLDGFARDSVNSPVSTFSAMAGLFVLGLLYLLGRLPRRRAAASAQAAVSHVVHHHVLHGLDGQAEQLPESVWTASVIDGTAPREVPVAAPKAIEAYAARASAFIGRRGELAARLREMRASRS